MQSYLQQKEDYIFEIVYLRQGLMTSNARPLPCHLLKTHKNQFPIFLYSNPYFHIFGVLAWPALIVDNYDSPIEAEQPTGQIRILLVLSSFFSPLFAIFLFEILLTFPLI